MKLPLSLIQSFIQIEMPPEKIGEVLTLLGIEVDQIHNSVFELSLTPNLGHCMSALGIARELSAALQIPLHRPHIEIKDAPLDKKVVVQDFHLCPRYMCRWIEGIKAGPSPAWLKQQLEACGQKSINHVVDIANYIMMKVGQPLHAFDADLLEGDILHVAPSQEAQKFLGLDGIEREIPAGALLIADGVKTVAIAGIIGGANSAVSEKTTRILLEAACFDPISIRNTSRTIGIRSESSQRFEKGVDVGGVESALNEACQLLGGTVKGGIDLKKGPFTRKKIPYRVDRINQILGTQLSKGEIEDIFKRLGFQCAQDTAAIPLYRTDVAEEIDLIEEIARIYGYNNIEKKTPLCTLSQIPHDPVFLFENKIRRHLSGLGLFEWLTSDLISPKLAELSPPSAGLLKSAYSKSEEYSFLRTSLLPALLQAAKGNFAQKNQNLSAFEIGRIHFLQQGNAVEIPMLAILLTGKRDLPHWSHKSADVDFFDLKGLVETLVSGQLIPSNHIVFHPHRQADAHAADLVAGSLGEVHPALLEKFGIKQRIYYAEFNLLHLLHLQKTDSRMVPLPQYPASERDWTLPADPKIALDQILSAIRSVDSSLLEHVELIDLYQPESANQKHATFRFTYRDKFKTVSFEEVEIEHAKITLHVMKLLAK